MSAPLHRRLAISFASICGLVLLLFASLVYGILDQALYSGVEEGARVVANNVALTIDPSPSGPVVDAAAFSWVAAEATRYQGVAGIDVRSPMGGLLAHYGIELGPISPLTSAEETIRSEDNLLWVHTQVIKLQGQPVGVVRVARPLRDMDRTLSLFAIQLGTLSLAALFTMVVTGLWIAGRAMAPIQASVERLRSFTADASHELRTPIAIVLAQAESVAASPPTDEAGMQRAMEPIQRAAKHLASLVGDLLFLARTDGATLSLVKARLDLDELVEALVEEYTPLAAAKGLKLAFEGQPLLVEVDPQRLHQLIANLVDNAIKYTDSGGVWVTVTSQAAPPAALVRVRDSGCGIAPEQLPRVFDRFFRTDSARSGRRPGTGLGLAIAHAIAFHHGAEIRLESQPGQGTTATLVLPLG